MVNGYTFMGGNSTFYLPSFSTGANSKRITELQIRWEIDDNSNIFFSYFSNFSLKIYVVTPHLNRLGETVLKMGRNICFKRVF